MTVSKIIAANEANCRRGAVYTGATVQTWTPKVLECGTVVNATSGRFDEVDYYCCGSGTGGGDTTIVNEGDTYVTNIINISGSGIGGGLTYLELGEAGTITADTSGNITNEARIPGSTNYTFHVLDAVATLGASGDTPTKVGLYITDGDGVTASPIHFTIPRNSVYHVVEGIVGQTIPPSGYIQKNIVTAGVGAADLVIGLYGTLT